MKPDIRSKWHVEGMKFSIEFRHEDDTKAVGSVYG